MKKIIWALLFNTVVCVTAIAGDLSALRSCVEKNYGTLAKRQGIVAAVVDAESAEIMTFGNAQVNQFFEIGSITKTFTANLLAQAIVAGEIQLADAIPTEYQKEGSVITYQHLTTHTSGLGAMLPEFKVTNPLFPYEGLTISIFKELYPQTPLSFQPGTASTYSNIGVSLLGLILAEKARTSYEELVQKKIFGPLKMTNSYFQVPESQVSRFPRGRLIETSGQTHEIPHWDLFNTAIDPAGGIRSTIGDMVKYARANIPTVKSPLKPSIALSHQPLYQTGPDSWLGMNWVIHPTAGLVWHNGATYGYNSILVVSLVRNQAIVAMSNTFVLTKDANGVETIDNWLQDVAFACIKQ